MGHGWLTQQQDVELPLGECALAKLHVGKRELSPRHILPQSRPLRPHPNLPRALGGHDLDLNACVGVINIRASLLFKYILWDSCSGEGANGWASFE